MKRRDLLKAIPASAVATNFGRSVASFFGLPVDRKYIAFVNEDAMPADRFAKIKFPVEVTICPVRIPEGQKIDDAIRIYELGPD